MVTPINAVNRRLIAFFKYIFLFYLVDVYRRFFALKENFEKNKTP